MNSQAVLGRDALGSWTIGVRTVGASRRCTTFGASRAALDSARAQATHRGLPPKTDKTVPIVINKCGVGARQLLICRFARFGPAGEGATQPASEVAGQALVIAQRGGSHLGNRFSTLGIVPEYLCPLDSIIDLLDSRLHPRRRHRQPFTAVLRVVHPRFVVLQVRDRLGKNRAWVGFRRVLGRRAQLSLPVAKFFHAYAAVVDWAEAVCGWVLELVRKPEGLRTFQVLPHRWVVERTFGWLNRCRQLSKDYERDMGSSAA